MGSPTVVVFHDTSVWALSTWDLCCVNTHDMILAQCTNALKITNASIPSKTIVISHALFVLLQKLQHLYIVTSLILRLVIHAPPRKSV